MILLMTGSMVMAATPAEDFAKKWVKTIVQQKVDTSYPSWLQPDVSETNDDFTHWMNVLPFAEDRYTHKVYAVFPKYGLVIPVLDQFDRDSSQIAGKSAADVFNSETYNDLLVSGGYHHPGTFLPTDGAGNFTFAIHSSYRKDKPGRYKTAWQPLVRMDAGDAIWLYVRDENDYYRKYGYFVEKSYRVPASDTGIGIYEWWHKLTSYVCVDFGTARERWVLKAQQNYANGWALGGEWEATLDAMIATIYQQRPDALDFFAQVLSKVDPVLQSFSSIKNPRKKRLFTATISYLAMRMDTYTY